MKSVRDSLSTSVRKTIYGFRFAPKLDKGEMFDLKIKLDDDKTVISYLIMSTCFYVKHNRTRMLLHGINSTHGVYGVQCMEYASFDDVSAEYTKAYDAGKRLEIDMFASFLTHGCLYDGSQNVTQKKQPRSRLDVMRRMLHKDIMESIDDEGFSDLVSKGNFTTTKLLKEREMFDNVICQEISASKINNLGAEQGVKADGLNNFQLIIRLPRYDNETQDKLSTRQLKLVGTDVFQLKHSIYQEVTLKRIHLWLYSRKPNMGKTCIIQQITSAFATCNITCENQRFFHGAGDFNGSQFVACDEYGNDMRNIIPISTLNQLCQGTGVLFRKNKDPVVVVPGNRIFILASNKPPWEVYTKESTDLLMARFHVLNLEKVKDRTVILNPTDLDIEEFKKAFLLCDQKVRNEFEKAGKIQTNVNKNQLVSEIIERINKTDYRDTNVINTVNECIRLLNQEGRDLLSFYSTDDLRSALKHRIYNGLQVFDEIFDNVVSIVEVVT